MSRPRLRASALAGAALFLISVAPAVAFDGTVKLPLDPSRDPSEPHLAVNPANPSNAIVVAHDSPFDPSDEGLVLTSMRSWATSDAGASWGSTTALAAPFEGFRVATVSDPVVAFSPDGSIIHYASLLLTLGGRSWQSLIVNGRSRDAGASYPEADVPVRTVNRGRFPRSERDAAGVERVARRNRWTLNDKEWIAVDQTAGPFRGTIYLTWLTAPLTGGASSLKFTRSVDGGQTFSTPVEIEREGNIPQVAVRPDGKVDLVWAKIEQPQRFDRDFEARAASSGFLPVTLRHAVSTDGGASFSAPQTLATWRSPIFIDGARELPDSLPTMAIDPAGRLLVCWSQALFGPRRWVVLCSRSTDGNSWSPPAAVADTSAGGTLQILPATAAAGGAFWLTLYTIDSSTSRVTLYRSADGGATFTEHQGLAEAPYGKRRFPFVGDYTGLAPSGNRLLAAFALAPRTKAPNDLYLSSVPTS